MPRKPLRPVRAVKREDDMTAHLLGRRDPYWQTCISCDVVFGVSTDFDSRRRQDKASFYCPNGHPQCYSESEADKLRQERDRLKQNAAYLEDRLRAERAHREAAQNQARAFKGVATKLKKRVAGGACPCCNRTFLNLQRHMATKHSGFLAEEVLPEGATVQ